MLSSSIRRSGAIKASDNAHVHAIASHKGVVEALHVVLGQFGGHLCTRDGAAQGSLVEGSFVQMLKHLQMQNFRNFKVKTGIIPQAYLGLNATAFMLLRSLLLVDEFVV